MIFLNQKSTDQTESLGGGATTLGGGTPETGSGLFRLNFIATLRIGLRFGWGWGCPLPGSAKRRDFFKRFYDIPLLLDCVAYESNKK